MNTIHIKDLKVGTKLGDITIIGINRKTYNITCQCKCGTIYTTNAYYLKHKLNCGCNKNRYIHNPYNKGFSGEQLYRRWLHILDRCYNPKNVCYYRYGQRGIFVCDQWRDKKIGYLNFKSWALNNGYKKELEIDRIDNNKGYSPDNCRWVTRQINAQNRNGWGKQYIYKGKLGYVCDIAKKSDIPYSLLYRNIHRLNYFEGEDITFLCNTLKYENFSKKDYPKNNKQKKTIIPHRVEI